MNRKIGILCLSLLALPSCFNLRRHHIIPQQRCLLKKACLYINDIECEDCFKLIQAILLPIKGISSVLVEKMDNYCDAGTSTNPVIVTYDPLIDLDLEHIKMILEEWTFELQKIELKD